MLQKSRSEARCLTSSGRWFKWMQVSTKNECLYCCVLQLGIVRHLEKFVARKFVYYIYCLIVCVCFLLWYIFFVLRFSRMSLVAVPAPAPQPPCTSESVGDLFFFLQVCLIPVLSSFLCFPKNFGGAYSRQVVSSSQIRVRPITSLFEVEFLNYFTEMITILSRHVVRKFGSLP